MIKLNINQAELEKICRTNKVEFIGLFGSIARGEDRPNSDIDMLVRFSPQAKVGYFKLHDIEQALKKGLGSDRKIDLVTQDALNPYIKDHVYSELKTIYGQP